MLFIFSAHSTKTPLSVLLYRQICFHRIWVNLTRIMDYKSRKNIIKVDSHVMCEVIDFKLKWMWKVFVIMTGTELLFNCIIKKFRCLLFFFVDFFYFGEGTPQGLDMKLGVQAKKFWFWRKWFIWENQVSHLVIWLVIWLIKVLNFHIFRKIFKFQDITGKIGNLVSLATGSNGWPGFLKWSTFSKTKISKFQHFL